MALREQKSNIKNAILSVLVYFNSSKTTEHTNIKLDTVDHHLEVSVIRGWQRHHHVTIKDNFFKI